MTVSVSASRGSAVERHEMPGAAGGRGQPIFPSLPLSSIVNRPSLNARRLGPQSVAWRAGADNAAAGYSGRAAWTGIVAQWRRGDSRGGVSTQERLLRADP